MEDKDKARQNEYESVLCGFWWPFLEPLWNPLSHLDFVELILSVQRNLHDTKITPCLVISIACMMGYVKLMAQSSSHRRNLKALILKGYFGEYDFYKLKNYVGYDLASLRAKAMDVYRDDPRIKWKEFNVMKGWSMDISNLPKPTKETQQKMFELLKDKGWRSPLMMTPENYARDYYDVGMKSAQVINSCDRCPICINTLSCAVINQEVLLKRMIELLEDGVEVTSNHYRYKTRDGMVLEGYFSKTWSDIYSQYVLWGMKERITNLCGRSPPAGSLVSSGTEYTLRREARMRTDFWAFEGTLINGRRLLKELEQAVKTPLDTCSDPVQIEPCGHVFGRLCITQWITLGWEKQRSSKRRGPTCPMCRTRLGKRDRQYFREREISVQVEVDQDRWTEEFAEDDELLLRMFTIKDEEDDTAAVVGEEWPSAVYE